MSLGEGAIISSTEGAVMSSTEGAESSFQNQTQTIEAVQIPVPGPQPPVKRRKRSRRSRSRTPPEFWDNLSRVPLCHRALREFNRRAVRRAAPKPLVWSVVERDLIKQLKRFARHGGPDLQDIRGVGSVHRIESYANSFLTVPRTGNRTF
jgi:hypothetical protein